MTFLSRFEKEDLLTGTFVQTGHPIMSEFIGTVGFDFILIEAEHSVMTEETILHMVQSLAASKTNCLVRVPGIDRITLSRFMDMGVEGIVIPQLRTLEDLETIKKAILHPPYGERGLGNARMYGYGYAITQGTIDEVPQPFIGVQIETKEALEILDEIASSEYIDSLFIGPADLGMSLGIFGDFDHPVLTEKIKEIVEVAKKYDKKVGMYAGNIDMAVKWAEFGLDYVVINSDLGMLQEAALVYLDKIDEVRNKK